MKTVWAYACELQRTTTGRMSLQPPIEGILEGNDFIPFGKSGKLARSKSTHRYTRKYAGTYEEAKEKYNEEIDKLIQYYEDQIERLKEKRE